MQTIRDAKHFCVLLGIPEDTLLHYIHKSDRFYKQFKIKKRSGKGSRTICAPSRDLKGMQRWIMAFILREVEVSNASTAFREGNSIFLNAFPHTNKDFVYCTDIKDFFPSIHIKRVVGLFKEMGYSPTVAYYLAKLTTYKESLPQGAPTSPDIANIICRRLDSRLLSLSARNRWNYTRYCDNITISGNGNFTGNSIVQKIVAEEGFILNRKKTYISRRNCHQGITGLVANEKVNIPRHRRKNIRAMFHQAWLNPEKSRGKVAELMGHLGFLKMIRPSDPAITKYKEIIASLSSPGLALPRPSPPR